MRLLQKGIWREKLDVADLLERKGCNEFTLLEDKLSVREELFEIWWYVYDGQNHILAKSKRYPTRLYFFLLEPGDLFAVNDFRVYLETGELKHPIATHYKKTAGDQNQPLFLNQRYIEKPITNIKSIARR